MGDDFGNGTKIEKLNDSNFHAWKQKMVLILALKDLDEFIEKDPPSDKSELAKWEKNDRKARAIVGLSLSDEHLEHVREVKTAKEMWKAIMNVFERQTLLNRLSARRKFYTVTMENGEKMLTYLNRVKQLAATLKSMSVEIDDQELAMAALNGLPASYESLIVALDALGNDKTVFTFDLVKSRLLQEEQRATEREMSESIIKPSALVGVSEENHEKIGTNGKHPHRYSKHRCETCGNIGHSASVCWGKDVNGRRPPNPNKMKRNNALFARDDDSSIRLMEEKDFVCLMANINDSNFPKGTSSWVVDSGCTAHICFDRSMFDTYNLITETTVEMGTKETAKVAGKGTITLGLECGSEFKVRKLENVLHVPSFEYSLLSVSAIDKKGMKTTFGGGECVIHKNGFTIATGCLKGPLYEIHAKRVPLKTEKAFLSLQLWHERMAHTDKRGILRMADKGLAKGLKIQNRDLESICDNCAISKAQKSPIPKKRSSERATNMLDKVHSDVCGPMEVPSLSGSRYFVTFIDEHSNWVMLYLLKRKSEVTERFLEYEKYAERQTGRKIKILRSDRGGEYLSTSLSKHFQDRGIVHELTTAYTPHQNGKAERFNRTCMNLVRSMLHNRNVPKQFWAEALSTAVHVRNRVTSNGLPPNITPHLIWKNSIPDVSYFRVFGCKCWYTIPRSKVQKLGPRGKVAIFVGYAETSKAFKLIDLETYEVVISRDVLFDEKSNVEFESDLEIQNFDFSNEFEVDKNDLVGLGITDPTVESSTTNEEEIGKEGESGHDEDACDKSDCINQESESELEHDIEENLTEDENSGTVLRSGRISKPPTSWWKTFSTSEQDRALIATSSRKIPTSYTEAISGPDASFWKEGIDSEIESLKKHNTWKLVPRSETKGRKVLSTKWVFVEKQKVENRISTPYPKGRNVVRGCEQVQGVDYGETFAPVVKYSSVRALCAMVAEKDLELEQMDAKTAFLNGEIDEDIFIEIPEGVEITYEDLLHLDIDNIDDISKIDLVCKLEKSMYGTKQAPRCWNKKINSVLANELGFVRSDGDPCLYVKRTKEGVMMIALYVDDLLLATKTKSQTTWIKNMLSDRFDMKDLGEAQVCLGLEIARDRKQKKLWLTQKSYMEKILNRFGMGECKPVATPMEEPKSPDERIEVISDQDVDAIDVPYREAIGSLMYLMIGSRPDISYAVGKLARFCESPKWKHWIAVKRVLRYVSGTSTMGLCYNGSMDGKLIGHRNLDRKDLFGYTDSDWAGDVSDRKSTSSYMFMMGGAPVSWCSKKQTVVATSSCEAEYIAMSMACKEAIWLKRLLSNIPIWTDLSKGIILLSDSQSGINLSKNESINRRNKHIDITYHFVRHVTDEKEVLLRYTPTSEMVADMLNKPLGRVKFEKLRKLCGMRFKGE